MESYAPLFEKIRIPQPSLQKLAVITIFDKIRSEPPSAAAIDAVTRCLQSLSPHVVDQSTRELCRLVKDSKFDLSTALMELQSALEGSSSPQFSTVLIKAIGFLTRHGFQQKPSSFRFSSSEFHPFVKMLSCGVAVDCELVKQVAVFIVKCKHMGMEAVCEYLGPFLSYSVVNVHMSGCSSAFVKSLISTILAYCCSFPQEAIPLMNMLVGHLNHFSCKNVEEVTNVSYVVECLADAYMVVLRQLVGMRLLIHEAQLCGLALLEAVLFLYRDFQKCPGGVEKLLDVSSQLLTVQKELSLNYLTEFSSAMLSLFAILVQSEFEHEQYSILKLVLFLLRWKNENEHHLNCTASELSEELLFIFPVLALVCSPSRRVKQIAIGFLSFLGKIASILLTSPKRKQMVNVKLTLAVTPGHLMFRFMSNFLFEDLSSSSRMVYFNFISNNELYANQDLCGQKIWISSIKEYCHGIIKKLKFTATISHSEENFLTEMPSMLCAIASVFLLHNTEWSSIDLFSVICNMEPKLGVPLLLVILFYIHMLYHKQRDDSHDMLPKLLDLVPSLASHPAMTPLVVQVLLPMLHKDMNPVVKATAIRLICKAWVINDRIFGSLHRVLHQDELTKFASERGICISIALSIQDVCKQNPDRGVDLILSVAACIENHDPWVQSLGFQSLAHLCEADVIDFYTAWDVIALHAQNYLQNVAVAYGLSLLLKWGAMDAESYLEPSTNVLNILWNIVTYKEENASSEWTGAQEAAITSLMQYEVVHIYRSIPDFSDRNLKLLVEANTKLLNVVDKFEVKILNYEHITRRRFQNPRKQVSGSKIVKLLDIVPKVLFTSDCSQQAKELPGAALLSLPNNKDKNQGVKKDVHAEYESEAADIAATLKLSRNILLALYSLQSWKIFMQRWIQSGTAIIEAKDHLTMSDKTLKTANRILKGLKRISEGANPRSSENIALALGGFCLVLPPSAHTVKSMASKFLLSWLSQYEHEHRQWSAAISTGLISSCLHVTDHQQKFENINMLCEVASASKSALVKGACGVGLGFSCQDLLTRVNSESGSLHEMNEFKMQEAELLRKIVRTLVVMISQFTGSSADILEKLALYFPVETDNSTTSPRILEFLTEDFYHLDLEEDAWSAAGPIIGLGNSFSALYRAGAHDAIIYLKSLIVSWLPSPNDLSSKSDVSTTYWQMFSLGACLALPSTIFFCQKVELIDHAELAHLLNGFLELISGLLCVELFDTFHQSLLMASCVGAGNLLSVILDAGVHSLEVGLVKEMLVLFGKTYLRPHPPLVHLGGMLGVINAIGAGVGMLFQQCHFPSMQIMFDQEESSHILGPLLSNHVLEFELTSSVQEIFLAAQKSDDPHLKHYAAWTVSYLRSCLFSEEIMNGEIVMHNRTHVPNSNSHALAEDSLVMKLSFWLMKTNFPELGTRFSITTVACVLRCLSQAPRLPALDWGAVVRRCMKYGDQVVEVRAQNLAVGRTLREECFLFSLSHANQFDSLLGFLDELSDVARFKTLELNMQSLVLLHLQDILKIFSNSRIVKLLEDLADFLLWLVSYDHYSQAQKISLRVSCWKGLHSCLYDSAIKTQDYTHNLELFMEILFSILPWSQLDDTGLHCSKSNVEWTEAISCLGKARQSWLSDLLQSLDADVKEEDAILKYLKKIKAKAALVRIGSVPLLELSKLKAFILDMNSEVIWNILEEVAATLHHTEINIRRQWLIDTSEVLCVTNYPSTALRFLGLLAGSSCKYMCILMVDKSSVLSDLPITLSSLLAESEWEIAAESVASYVWTATKRIYDWVKLVEQDKYVPGSQPIHISENDMAGVLLQVVYQTCLSLKNYLPVKKRLTLANMKVS